MSVISKKDTLITRDSKGKIRQINIACEWNEKFQMYVITRSSGLYGGKFITQPNIEITKGKVKRTITEQAELEYNSNIKSYLDKGYKKISDLGYTSIDEFDPDKVLPKDKTDTKGVKKPMLCKVYDASDSKTQKIPYWFISSKLDGVRCFLFMKDGEIKTSSRGGQDYDIATTYIKQDPFLLEVFRQFPNIILDGEIYRHGWNLSTISGLCRLESIDERHKELCFHCYDIVDEESIFSKRFNTLQNLYQLRETNYPESKLVIVEHTVVRSNQEIMAAHNKFVAEGYEGAVIRDPNEVYKCGGRDRRMQKIKIFSDAEFKILGLSEGLRDEDMCFIMETTDGNQFKAKPIGTREDKQWYRDHIKELIGKMGTVKYFGMTNTEHPVPNLPVFKSVRLDKDA